MRRHCRGHVWRTVMTVVRNNGEVEVYIERFPTEAMAFDAGNNWMEGVKDPCHWDEGSIKHCDFVVEPVGAEVPA